MYLFLQVDTYRGAGHMQELQKQRYNEQEKIFTHSETRSLRVFFPSLGKRFLKTDNKNPLLKAVLIDQKKIGFSMEKQEP